MLLDALHIAGKSLNASGVGIQVAGQNLMNADTPGYVREQTQLTTSSPKKTSQGYTLGTGVEVTGVMQMIDLYLEERLRNSQSDAMNTATQSNVYNQLEFILSELSDQDLSSELDTFFNSISSILNQPESLSTRQMTVDEGERLATLIRSMSSSIINARLDINKEISSLADQINVLTTEIANLNRSIAQIEAGKSAGNEAVGLRDQRLVALSNLSLLINIKTSEDASGVVTVYCGGDMLISTEGAKPVTVGYKEDPYGQFSLAEIRFASNNAPLDIYSGKLNGMYEGRDSILGPFSEQLNEYTRSLIVEFNKIYSSGQGLTGYDSLTGLTSVKATDVSLDHVGLLVQPKSGVFTILVNNKETGIATSTEISVSFADTGSKGTTLEELAQKINTIEGISAKITNGNQLQITSDSPELDFAFADDSSGILAGLGLNTFFTGTNAQTIGVNSVVKNDPGKFAVSQTGIGADTDNGVRLANMPEMRLSGLNNKSISESYRLLYSETISKAGTVKAVATGDLAYATSLSAQRNAISGVNIDEETLMLMSFQRIYQATSKYITTINSMLDFLLNI